MSTPARLAALPPAFVVTREALRTLACYVVAPARKARTGRIGLRPFGAGFATPAFDDGTRLAVEGDHLGWVPGESVAITTVRDAAAWVGVALSADPGVGADLPPFAPDAPLAVDAAASRALGAWYAFGQQVLDGLPTAAVTITEAQLWPEHFDLAVVVALEESGRAVNVGCSPGDADHEEPYVYVGPHDLTGLTGDYWNAPFGALLPHEALRAAPDPVATALDFVTAGLRAVHHPPSRF